MPLANLMWRPRLKACVDERPLKVTSAELLGDGKSVAIAIPDIAPTWCVDIRYELKGADRTSFTGIKNNTIHETVK